MILGHRAVSGSELRREALPTPSAKLLTRFPFLADAPEWNVFAKEYDRAPCIKKREEAETSQNIPGADPKILAILERCQYIESECFFGTGLGLNEDVWDGFWGEEDDRNSERMLHFARAASSLAQDLRTLLDESDHGEEMRRLFAAEAKRRQRSKPGQNDDRMGQQAHLALLGFIKRELRLPSKNELNVEVRRMREPIVRTTYRATPLPYGERRRDPTTDRFVRVRDCQKSFVLPIDDPEDLFRVEWVDAHQWDLGMWHIDTLGKEVLKPFGFAGLAKSSPTTRGAS
jgi:hypothetical protein